MELRRVVYRHGCKSRIFVHAKSFLPEVRSCDSCSIYSLPVWILLSHEYIETQGDRLGQAKLYPDHSLSYHFIILQLWRTPVLLPFKLITVFLHEASHATACKLTCGKVCHVDSAPSLVTIIAHFFHGQYLNGPSKHGLKRHPSSILKMSSFVDPKILRSRHGLLVIS